MPLEALQHVWVVSDDDVGAGVDAASCHVLQPSGPGLGELEAAVELHDDKVRAAVPQPGDVGLDGVGPEPRRPAVPSPRHPVLELGEDV